MSKKRTIAGQRVPETIEELQAVLSRAEAGDASTLPLLREMLRVPNSVNVLGGNLAQVAESSFITAIAGEDLRFAESLRRRLELMRTELAGPNPTAIERLLVERIVACWLQVQDADTRCAQMQSKCSLPLVEFAQRRMTRAHNRFLGAVKSLALVRKLALPALNLATGSELSNYSLIEKPRNASPIRNGRSRLSTQRNRFRSKRNSPLHTHSIE